MPNIEMFTPTSTIQHNTQYHNAKASDQKPAPAPTEAPPPAAQVTPEAPQPKVEAEGTNDQPDPRFLAISRKEKALFRKEQEIKQREKMMQDQAKPWQEAAEIAKTSKVEALKRLGFSYDEITQEMLGQNAPTPEALATIRAEQVASQKIEEFKKSQAEEHQKNVQAQYHSALNNIRQDVKALVTSSDSFPIVKTAELSDTVTKHIEDEFHKTGRVLGVEEATRQVEQDTLEGLLELAKLPSYRSKLLEILQVDEKPVSQGDTRREHSQQPTTTITNRVTQSSGSKDDSAAAKRQRAIDVFYGRAK